MSQGLSPGSPEYEGGLLTTGQFHRSATQVVRSEQDGTGAGLGPKDGFCGDSDVLSGFCHKGLSTVSLTRYWTLS